MGQEAFCKARFAKKASQGKALLESNALVFRGDFRLAIPFQAMKSVSVVNGALRIRFPEGVVSFELGPQAENWAQKILHPKSLLEKLGVNSGAAVSVLGVSDSSFLRQLRERTTEIADEKPRQDCDFIFFAAEAKADLKRLKALRNSLKPAGAIWVVYPKGQTGITQADVMAASKEAGLVDVKVVSFSAIHTALKLVIPVSRQ